MNNKENQKKEAATPMATERLQPGPTFAPPVDIVETKDAYVLKADMPGVEAKDVQIDFDKGVLTIRAHQAACGTGGECLFREFEPGAYERSFTVSEQVDAEKIAAQCAHGVLTLTLPKAEAVKPRTIKVTAA